LCWEAAFSHFSGFSASGLLTSFELCYNIKVSHFLQDSVSFLEGNTQMPKQKTHKGLKKRVKVTAGGKIKRGRAGGGHLLSGKTAKRRRKISSPALVRGAIADTIKEKLCV